MNSSIPSAAVIGAGVAGASCADRLARAGWRVMLFDKSRGVGGRMATRRMSWPGADGAMNSAEFDHGASHFIPSHPEFRALIASGVAQGWAARWRPRVHSHSLCPPSDSMVVGLPGMPALCRRLTTRVPLALEQTVERLERTSSGWLLHSRGDVVDGPFDRIVLAMPPAQAAALLAGHQPAWSHALLDVPMVSSWVLMAVTNEVDWPWDACEPRKGPLSWVVRNDRKPGRSAALGTAHWVAHADPLWSASCVEASPEQITQALQPALQALLPASSVTQWHLVSAHRWRYAACLQTPPAHTAHATQATAWWDDDLALGVCGDYLVGHGVEAAWRSGTDLAHALTAPMVAATDARSVGRTESLHA